jgi:hypothetical protein
MTTTVSITVERRTDRRIAAVAQVRDDCPGATEGAVRDLGQLVVADEQDPPSAGPAG